MALVAYSDESDISDSDDLSLESSTPSIGLGHDNNKAKSNFKEEIDAEEDSNSKTSLTDISESTDFSELDVNDVVNDVPTVRTWNVTKNNASSKGEPASTVFKTESKRKTKLKLVLPALTEFEDDDDEEENIEESVKKKVKPSSSGTGLFAVLPKPRDSTLVPLSVSRNKTVPKPKTKPKPKPSKSLSSNDAAQDSDEELPIKGENTDFFSLSDSGKKFTPDVSVPLPSLNPDPVPLSQNNSPILIHPMAPPPPPPRIEERSLAEQNEQPVDVQPDFIPFSNGDTSSDIDPEALRRLAGRRNAKEIPTIIDINADDALMKREEWVTRALCEEKPKKSFSKKREGNPTQQQKRKHQITYLAHQAQEREQELQSTWGQNRFTKMQTQSKYGF